VRKGANMDNGPPASLVLGLCKLPVDFPPNTRPQQGQSQNTRMAGQISLRREMEEME